MRLFAYAKDRISIRPSLTVGGEYPGYKHISYKPLNEHEWLETCLQEEAFMVSVNNAAMQIDASDKIDNKIHQSFIFILDAKIEGTPDGERNVARGANSFCGYGSMTSNPQNGSKAGNMMFNLYH